MRKTLVVVALLVLSALAAGVRASQQPFQPPAFEAKVYENAELGFSVYYPADFLEQDMPPGSNLGPGAVLLVAASPQVMPTVTIVLHRTGGKLSLEALGGQLAAVYSQIPGGGEAKIESARQTTLQDGVTEAMEFLIEVSVEAIPLKTLTLFVPRGPQTVQVAVTWVDAIGDRASLNVGEIVYSLNFKWVLD